MNFEDITYLRSGSARQQRAYHVLTNHQLLTKLGPYDPILAGTIPLNVDIENSDLDIICCFTDKRDFESYVIEHFCTEKNFSIREQSDSEALPVVANFVVEDFLIEIFGQNVPTKQQFAYRHMIVEYNLLKQYGEKLRQQIIALKQLGHKTEPAFALALGLKGDPYLELLKFENCE